MKFDLFDALNIIKEHFGNDGEILLLQDDNTISIRLRVYKNNKLYNNAIAIHKEDLNDDFVSIMNIRFNRSIIELIEDIKKE